MTDAMFRALVVEDDESIQLLIRTLLESQGFRVMLAPNAQRAVLESKAYRPDVVILDLGLPDRDGQRVIRDVREFSTVPIIVLSARSADAEKIAALDGGADDYVTKPFSAAELLARVRAALRRSVRSAEQASTLNIGTLTLDLARREARGPAGHVHFTPLEFRVLECLARNRGLVVTQEQLMREVWGPDRVEDTRGLRAYVKMLRQKLEPDPGRPRYLLTDAGVGYRLQVD